MTLIRLKELYAQVPKFKCIKNCSKCCGAVPWASLEMDQLKEIKVHKNLICPYCEENKCTIYEFRPFMCRIFGTVAKPHPLACPYGAMPVSPLPGDKVDDLMRQYQMIANYDFNLIL